MSSDRRAGVEPVVARPAVRRRGDAEVNLGRPGLPQHAHHGPGGGAPHDGVVDDHQALAGDGVPERVELAPHALGPLGLVGHDEGAADVAVLDQTRGRSGCRSGGRSPRPRAGPSRAPPSPCRRPTGACSASSSPMRIRAPCSSWLYSRLSGRARYTNSNRHSLGSMRSAGQGRSERGPSASMTSSSPGSSSRTKWAPVMSRAGRLRGQHPARGPACPGRGAGSRAGPGRR